VGEAHKRRVLSAQTQDQPKDYITHDTGYLTQKTRRRCGVGGTSRPHLHRRICLCHDSPAGYDIAPAL